MRCATMEQVTRFGVSMEPELLAGFDDLCERKGYPNRSEAIRDLVRGAIVEKALERPETPVVGTISIIYDHHAGGLKDRLADIQHQYHHEISSTTHIHLDHDTCLEVIIVRGRAGEVRALGERLAALRGVTRGNVFLSASGGVSR